MSPASKSRLLDLINRMNTDAVAMLNRASDLANEAVELRERAVFQLEYIEELARLIAQRWDEGNAEPVDF